MLWQFYIQVHVITCYSAVPFKSTVQAVLCCVHHNVLQHMKFFSRTSNIKTWDQTNSYMYCVSYWQLIKVCANAFLVLSFIKILNLTCIQIHFQMEIKPSTNSAAFINKKNNKKKHPKMNELDRKTWIRAVSTLRPSKFSKKDYVAWTLCNLISENTPLRLTSMIRKG